MDRRAFIAGLGTVSLAACSGYKPARSPGFSENPFTLGVASGDPDADGCVLWTRLAPQPLAVGGGLDPIPIVVGWELSHDRYFSDVFRTGEAVARPESAHSIHVELGRLPPGQRFFYRFRVGDALSPVGIACTLPAVGLEPLRLGLVSCQHYEQGFYHAYSFLLADGPDLIAHVGDYIYESNTRRQKVREHATPEPVNLEGYRLRHAQYKTDPNLQAAHAACPWIVTWDDHEVDNDYAAQYSQDFDPQLLFLQRRAAAYQAYYEHMPLRRSARPAGADMSLYRALSWGGLATLALCDNRQYRSDQGCPDREAGGGRMLVDCDERTLHSRSMLGFRQERWLENTLRASRSKWNVLVQQQLMAQLEQEVNGERAFWSDGWDGYPAARQRLMDVLSEVPNAVVLGGDIHSFWATELLADFTDPFADPVAAEFVTTSVSSYGIDYETFSSYLPRNPHVKYFDSRYRGYTFCEIGSSWTTRFRAVDTVAQPTTEARTLAEFMIEPGKKLARVA